MINPESNDLLYLLNLGTKEGILTSGGLSNNASPQQLMAKELQLLSGLQSLQSMPDLPISKPVIFRYKCDHF